jgi:hypothetical protein
MEMKRALRLTEKINHHFYKTQFFTRQVMPLVIHFHLFKASKSGMGETEIFLTG